MRAEVLPDARALPDAVAALFGGDGALALRELAAELLGKLAQADEVELPGLGTLGAATRGPYRAPDGSALPAVRVVRFFPSPALSAALRGGRDALGPPPRGVGRVYAAIARVLAEQGAGRPLEWPGLGELAVRVDGGRARVALHLYPEASRRLA